jgi:hypothetical protein
MEPQLRSVVSSRKGRQAWTVVGLVVLAALVAVGLIVVTSDDDDCEAFDSAAWQRPVPNSPSAREIDAPPTAREEQVDVLVDCDLLAGRSRAEVIELLGKPDREGPTASKDDPPKQSYMTWLLGTDDLGDQDVLTLVMSESGEVLRLEPVD